MQSYYKITRTSFFRTIVSDIINIGFKRNDEPPVFKSCKLEITFSSGFYNTLDSIELYKISDYTLSEYVNRLNGMILIRSDDSDSQDKYQTIDGELVIMTGAESTPMYLGYMLFSVIDKWLSSTDVGATLDSLNIIEVV